LTILRTLPLTNGLEEHGSIMSAEQDSRVYVLGEGIELYPAADHLIAVDTERDAVHHFNETAALILHSCTGRTVAEVCSHLSGEYPEVPMEQLGADVAQTLGELEAKHIVRTTGAGD
jgi:hypothetical protein